MEPTDTGSTDERVERQPRRLKTVAVAVSFAWLVAIAGFFVWAWWDGSRAESEAPDLVAAVDAAMRASTAERPGLRDELVATSKMSSFGAPDVLAEVPKVPGATAFQFLVGPDGEAVIGYRGTTLAEGICVRAELSDGNEARTARDACTTW